MRNLREGQVRPDLSARSPVVVLLLIVWDYLKRVGTVGGRGRTFGGDMLAGLVVGLVLFGSVIFMRVVRATLVHLFRTTMELVKEIQ